MDEEGLGSPSCPEGKIEPLPVTQRHRGLTGLQEAELAWGKTGLRALRPFAQKRQQAGGGRVCPPSLPPHSPSF